MNMTLTSKSFSAPENLSGPSDLVASLPGVLGFYPQESLIILGLTEAEAPNCVTLGPVMRADLTHAAQLCDALHRMPVDDCVAFYAVIVSRIPDSELVKAAVASLYDATHDCGCPMISACWHVSEIASGTPYNIVFGPGPSPLTGEPLGAHWVSGTVSSVIASPAMKNLLDNGALPQLSREDTYRYFDPLPSGDEAEEDNRDALAKLATRRGSELLERLSRGDRAAHTAAAEACLVLHSPPPRPLISPWEELSAAELEKLLGEEDDRLTLATMLSRSALRDRLIGEALETPLTAAHAVLCAAKLFPGTIRANALSVWAIIALDRGLTSWAVAALCTAQDELPGHSLSELVLCLVRAGQQDKLLQAVRAGVLDVGDAA